MGEGLWEGGSKGFWSSMVKEVDEAEGARAVPSRWKQRRESAKRL